MEIIFAIIFIVFAIVSENMKKQKKAQEKMKEILSEVQKMQPPQPGRVNPGSAFEQARQRATGNGNSAFAQAKRQGTRAVFSQNDPGRVTTQSVAQSKKAAEKTRQQKAKKAVENASPLMRPVVTNREKFERSSAYENSNRMDVQYTSNGCGCTTGKGNAAYGSSHGRTNAMYDEDKFFKESREICSGNWS